MQFTQSSTFYKCMLHEEKNTFTLAQEPKSPLQNE